MGNLRRETLALLLRREYLSILLVFFLTSISSADSLSDWNISGSNTMRAEHYSVSGDASSAPWPHMGGQYYDEFDLNLWRNVSPWASQRIQLSGLVNDSKYRSDQNGGVLERASFFWEKGDTGIPFRLQMGDYYASQTPNTIQLGLKGLQIELQPAKNQSVQFFSGLRAPAYHDLGADLGVHTGFSWLLEGDKLGALNLIAVHYDRDANVDQVELNQNVYSFSWYRPFVLGSHSMEFESELAHFSGEYDVTGTLAEGDDQGFFAQLSGSSAPIGYQLRYERYGEHFHPAGGSSTADYRAIEGHVSWRFHSGLQLRGRAQSFRDGLESINPNDTHVAGLSLSGPLWAGSSLYTRLETFIQERTDCNNTVDSDTRYISMDLSAPLNTRTSLKGGLSWTSTEDQLTMTTSSKRQLRLAMDNKFKAGNWQSRVTPGIVLRKITGSREYIEIYPTLALSMTRSHHNIRFSYSLLKQNNDTATLIDTDIQQTALSYDYSYKQHKVGLEFNSFDRDPKTGDDTEAYRMGIYWRISFNAPRRPVAGVAITELNMKERSMPASLESIPGRQLAQINQGLEASHIKQSYNLEDIVVYEAQLLDEVDLHQRLALLHSAGKVDEAILILEFKDHNVEQMRRDYARVRNLLLKRYGSPETYNEKGKFNNNIIMELARGNFEHMLQWRTQSGYLRFGIPSRLDGQIRMEIRLAEYISSGNGWGLEAVN